MNDTEKFNSVVQKCHQIICAMSPDVAYERLAMICRSLIRALCAEAAIAPLYNHTFNSVLAYFPFISPLSCFDKDKIKLVDITTTDVLVPVVDYRFKLPRAIKDCRCGLDLDQLNDGKPCMLYLDDIQLLLMFEGKHHVYASQMLEQPMSIPVQSVDLCDYPVTLDRQTMLWHYGDEFYPAEWHAAAVWEITQLLLTLDAI